ncbi:MAG: hypothetical protein PHU25_01150, partial [Deltaproteobacteria bacterium]|nr:hypothetical protein [Deltaproteobacteria bacterium]
LTWQPQERPFDHPDSCCRFRLDGSKPVVATRNATVEFTRELILSVLDLLQREAEAHDGLDYLQIFKDVQGKRLWVIENDEAITALLPEDY